LTHIEDADDQDVRGQDSITNERFLDHDSSQVRKYGGLDVVTTARIFSNRNTRSLDLIGDGDFNPRPKSASQV